MPFLKTKRSRLQTRDKITREDLMILRKSKKKKNGKTKS